MLIKCHQCLGQTLYESRKESPVYDVDEEIPFISSASRQIADSIKSPLIIVEIGAGVSKKTTLLLQTITSKSSHDIIYIPVDVDSG